MAAVPSQVSASVGGKIPAATWNDDVRDAINFFVANRPIAAVVQNTAQAAIATATFADILFDAEVLDRDGQHSIVTNTGRVVIGNTLGWYRCSGYVAWVGGSVTSRRAQVALNGVAQNGSLSIEMAAATGFTAAVLHPFLVQATVSTDYVTLQGMQDSGGAIAPSVSGAYRSYFLVEWIGS